MWNYDFRRLLESAMLYSERGSLLGLSDVAEIVACGKSGLYDFLSFSGIRVVEAEEIDHILASATDTVVLVTDGISCSTELISDLEEKYGTKFVPVVLDPKQGVDVSSARRFVERALGVKLDR